MNWADAQWADGPKVAAWVDEHCPERTPERRYGMATERRLREWRMGAAAQVWAIDRMLTEMGRHMWELPDDVWLDWTKESVPSWGRPKRPPLKFADIVPKPCAFCGKEIPTHWRSGKRTPPARYELRVTCSRECSEGLRRAKREAA